MQNQFDLITIGDSTIDTFIRIHDATVECDVNREDCKICVPYGAKIPVDSIAYGVAGNAANVAVGASRLGMKVAIYTNLGDDDQGKKIQEELRKQGVDSTYVQTNKGKTSNLSVVLTFQGERTIFVYHQDWFYHLPNLDNSKWVYLTSMAQTFTDSKIMDEVYHYVSKSGAKLAFGPGTFQLKANIKRFPKILDNCELLIVNMTEAKQILGVDSKEVLNPRDTLSKLHMLGPKNVVITDGEEGSYGSDGNHNYKLGVLTTRVIERTGAGDAYSAGLITALNSNESFDEAMVWGTINAGHIISASGTQKALLTREELLRYRKTIAEFVAVLM